jgi:hypothetical protein
MVLPPRTCAAGRSSCARSNGQRKTNERACSKPFFKPLGVAHPRPERLKRVILADVVAGDSFHRRHRLSLRRMSM